MIRDGYGLEPEEIAVAVEWLKLNPPDEPVPLQSSPKFSRSSRSRGQPRGEFRCFALFSVRLSCRRRSQRLSGPADAQPRQVQVGQLTCSVSASVGLIVGSQRNVNCVFRGQPGEPEESYTGTMTKVGLDVGFTTGGMIVWTVFADTNRQAAMLAGKYVGATAEASIAAGLGANVLVGGSQRSVALQPLSLQGQTGLNVAAGIGELDLYPAR